MTDLPKIDLAVRVYPEVVGREQTPRGRGFWRRPQAMLVFDTETRTDATQSLTFGCFRYVVDGKCEQEGLFHAADISSRELTTLREYAGARPGDVAPHGRQILDLMTLDEFLNQLFRAAYQGKCLLVGFNLPFDLSRIGFDAVPARGEYAGGFSIGLWSYRDKHGRRKRNGFRPRVGIKHIDSKRALIGFTARRNPDRLDRDSDEEPGKAKKFRGHFLDLRTLAFALTDRAHSLKSACDTFGVLHGKVEASEHGKITSDYIDYCRRDVEATAELAEILLREFERHPIKLAPTKAFSPASIGKAYLRAMGISPVFTRQTGLQPFIGHAQSAFFGGRTSAHIRKFPVPVVYTDFLSMYPTVNSLMGLWSFVTAKEIKVRDHCKDEIRSLLESIRVDGLFRQDTWKRFTGFVKVLPKGDALPSRGQYNSDTNDWQVAINHVNAYRDDDALWFSIPDVVASVILTGQVSEIVDAFILEAHDKLPNLRTTKLRRLIEIDPRERDFFKVVIEERKRLTARKEVQRTDKEQLDKFLKVLANSTSYGIYAEMNRLETPERMSVLCHGIDTKPFRCRVANPEVPGEFCFPPLASLITGGARLMLAFLEKCVTDLGGTYAMEDTDSMAIVATERGGLVRCPGGPLRMNPNVQAIKALSWQQVREISDRFRALNPYDEDAVLGSILKIEEDNFDPRTGEQRQIWCRAISAKRYALFLRGKDGKPELLRSGRNSKDNHWSEHGLGHLMNPNDPDSDDREWIAQVWNHILRADAGNRDSTDPFPFAEVPAIARITISSPATLRLLEEFNWRKNYPQQLKPFNFLLTCHIRPLGHPIGVDPSRFHLIGPYETDPAKWTQLTWIDQYSGKPYRTSTSQQSSSRKTAEVKTFGDVIAEYAFHAESKCADSRGKVCDKQTRGLLQRRHVHIARIRFIGKESNLLEEVEACLIGVDPKIETGE